MPCGIGIHLRIVNTWACSCTEGTLGVVLARWALHHTVFTEPTVGSTLGVPKLGGVGGL